MKTAMEERALATIVSGNRVMERIFRIPIFLRGVRAALQSEVVLREPDPTWSCSRPFARVGSAVAARYGLIGNVAALQWSFKSAHKKQLGWGPLTDELSPCRYRRPVAGVPSSEGTSRKASRASRFYSRPFASKPHATRHGSQSLRLTSGGMARRSAPKGPGSPRFWAPPFRYRARIWSLCKTIWTTLGEYPTAFPGPNFALRIWTACKRMIFPPLLTDICEDFGISQGTRYCLASLPCISAVQLTPSSRPARSPPVPWERSVTTSILSRLPVVTSPRTRQTTRSSDSSSTNRGPSAHVSRLTSHFIPA